MSRPTPLLLTCLLALAGCAGAPGPGTPPDWVTDPPPGDAAAAWFTGAGSSREGDPAAAEAAARSELIDGIMRYLGVRVTTETTAVARASVDSYHSDIVQQLTQAGTGRIAGLQLVDRYVERGKSGVTVYLLARYAAADLAAEKRRLEQVFREQEEAVAGPEGEGRELEGAGRLYEAAVKYLEAAAAAARSGVDNAAVKFERAVNEAKAALDRITLVKLNDNLATNAGTPFPEPFRVRAAAGSRPQDPPVADVALAVVFAEWRNDRRQVGSARIATGPDGIAVFDHPAPQFVGPERLSVGIDIAPYLEGLGRLTKDQQAMIAGLEDVAARKRVTFSLESVSRAREIPTAIAVAATGPDGKPLAGADFAAGILAALNGARYRVRVLDLDAATIAGAADADVVRLAAAQGGTAAARVVYGSAQVTGTEADSDMIVAKATATVKVADAKTGEVLLTIARAKSQLASTAAAAVAGALAALGEDVGREIAARLR